MEESQKETYKTQDKTLVDEELRALQVKYEEG
jgi:hypothetical protein